MRKEGLKPLIVALDVETDKEALRLVRLLSPSVAIFKVGPVLFLKYGGPLLQEINALGAKVFLDLKFHDIPSVVCRAVERAGEWGVYSVTVHVSGGVGMLEAAVGAKRRPLLWGVTVLTSLDDSDLKTLGMARGVPEQVNHLAKQADAARLDGVVASVREAKAIKQAFPRLTVVTPGIRFSSASDDQKRAETPARALENGADFIVVGRPIVEARDPVGAVKSIYQSIGVHL